MKDKYVNFYLYMVPLMSCMGILLSAFRISDGISFILVYLLFSLVLDLILVMFYAKSFWNKDVAICLFLLIPPLLVGLVNNEFSRRHLTDLLVPILFFIKVSFFSKYWLNKDISEYIKIYSKITLLLSFFLLIIVYSLFSSSGATRLSIFPPLELSASYYLFSNPILFVLSFFLIIAYGKRAQLISAIIVFCVSYRFVNYKMKLVFIMIACFIIAGVTFFISNDPNNISVRRFVYSIGLLFNGDFESINKLSAGRFDEVFAIFSEMEISDFLFGMGNGYTYELMLSSGEMKDVTNAHFTPVGLLSKYGIFYTLFVYYFFLKLLFTSKIKGRADTDKVVYLAVLFLFLESFFSYSLFVVSITPILIGSLLSFKDIKE
ncbi:hypothetical protein QL995_02645 [Pseudoalteromonas sp. APC 3358]|uniref:hypothetical protein n=2 Tax=unclassified Pseudoalteromonas TaxID=194690 RepID=UPI0025B4B46D|nr:hypothetical protein [Pseudoalteromonas sp. APC 3358]MDN3381579.1 hypothetical protein [Pseudoalteromonas sp. APC 3358]